MIHEILDYIKLKNNFIDVALSENFVNPGTGYNEVVFDTITNSRGNALTLENGKIKVGKGVKFIEVSGKMQFVSGSIATGGKNLVIRHSNNTYQERLMYSVNYNQNQEKVFATKPIAVNEGDTVDVLYYGAQGDVISAGSLFTHFYVKVI